MTHDWDGSRSRTINQEIILKVMAFTALIRLFNDWFSLEPLRRTRTFDLSLAMWIEQCRLLVPQSSNGDNFTANRMI